MTPNNQQDDKRLLIDQCEDLYWHMSTAKKGIRVALETLWDHAVQWQKLNADLASREQPAQRNSIYNCPIHNCVHMSDSECPGSREQPNDAVERVYVDTAFIDAAVKYKYENGALLNVAKAAISAMPVQPSQAKIEAMENTINLYAMRIEELEKMRLPEENEAVKIMLKRAVYDSGGHKVSNAAGDVLISAKHPINLTSIYRALLAKQGEK